MDGREGMALSSGSTPYYIHRGIPGPGSVQQSAGAFHPPHGYKPFPINPNVQQAQSSARPPASAGPTFSREQPSQHISFGHGIDVRVSPALTQSEPPIKKKRGRPRKYAPDGVALGLSPLPVRPKPSSDSNTPKKSRGRPPGTGRKQQLASLGEWMNSSAGVAFAPHVISVGVGEDIVEKLLSFSQQRPRALCILSGSGAVSSVTLRQPATMTPTVTFEGRFEILCLSGSYLVADEGGPRNRTGGISASLSSPDGHVVGGGVGRLIAASPVQVVVCSFVHGASKIKSKQVTSPTDDNNSSQQSNDKAVTPNSMISTQQYNLSPLSGWPGSRPVDLRNPHTDIDLTRG